MSESKRIQIPVTVDATGAKQGFEDVKQGAKDMANAVNQAGQQAGEGMRKIGEGAKGMGDGAKGVGEATQALNREQQRFLDSLKRTTTLVTEGKAAYLDQRAAMLGVSNQASDYIAKLREAERGQVNMGMSAKATAAALRQVPAQMQDIVVSLQGGQKPLTVLLQQGSQLSSVFGGAGTALKAVGGYLLGLVNPFTITAGVVGSLALAYHQGSKEADAFSRALILSGNAAGTTAGQMQLMAQRMDEVRGTQAKAAETLALMAANGRIGAENLEAFSLAAQRFESVTGTAVSDTAAQFADLAKSPLQASLKLDEAINYLTASTYRQIKALQEQGRLTEAADLAQRTYADTINSRSAEIEKNLGGIERGWKAIKNAISEAIDAALAVGRVAGPEAQLAMTRSTLAALERQAESRRERGLATGDLDRLIQASRQRVESLQKEVDLSAAVARSQREQEEAKRALQQWDKEGEQFRVRAARREEEIDKAKIEGQKLIAAGLLTEKELRERIASIQEKYKDTKADSAANAQKTQYDEILLRVRERIALADEELRAGRQLTENERLEVHIIELLASGKNKLTALQKEAIKSELQEAKAKEEKARQAKLELEAVKLLANERQRLRNLDYDNAAKALQDIQREYMPERYENVRKMIDAMEDEAKALQLSLALQISTAEAVERVTIARLEEKRAMLVEGSEAERVVRREIELRSKLATQIASREQTRAQVDALREIDSVAREVFRDVSDSGVDAFERIGKTIKSAVLDLIYQMTVRPIMIQIAGSITGASQSAIAQAIGVRNLGGLGNLFGLGDSVGLGGVSIGNTIGGVLNSIGLGNVAAGAAGAAGIGGSFASTVGAGLATDAMGATVAQGAAAATLGTGSSIGAALSAAAPYAAAALALTSLLGGSFKGETRFGGRYINDAFSQGPSGGEIAGASDAIRATIDSINTALKQMGSEARLKELVSGLEQSERGKGFAFAGGTLTTGEVFGQDYHTGHMNRRGNLTSQEASAAFAEELRQAFLQSLQAAGVGGILGEYLAEQGDIDKLVGAQLDAVYGRITNALTEKATLEEALYQLTATSLEKLYRTRERELEAVDTSNKAMLEAYHLQQDVLTLRALERREWEVTATEEQKLARSREDELAATIESGRAILLRIYALEDEKKALEASQEAARIALDTLKRAAADVQADALRAVSQAQGVLEQSYLHEAQALNDTISAHRAYAREIRQFRDSLLLDAPRGMLSVSDLYDQTVRGALRGDDGSKSQLTGVTNAMLEAARGSAKNSLEYLVAFAKVRGDLTKVANSADASADVAQLELDALKELVAPWLPKINESILSVTEAIKALALAQAGADAVTDANGDPAITAMALYKSNSAAVKNPTPDALDYWQRRLDSGEELAAILRDFNASVAYVNSLPGHASGLDRVPYDNYLFRAHKDEAVLTAPEARAWREGNGMAEVMQSLVAKVEAQAKALEAIAGHASATKLATQEIRDRGVIALSNPNGEKLKVD